MDSRVAWGLWVVITARALAAIPYVRTQILRTKSRPSPLWHSDAAQAVAVIAAVVGWWSDLVPGFATIALGAVAAINLVAVRSASAASGGDRHPADGGGDRRDRHHRASGAHMMSDADLGGDPPCWAHLFEDDTAENDMAENTAENDTAENDTAENDTADSQSVESNIVGNTVVDLSAMAGESAARSGASPTVAISMPTSCVSNPMPKLASTSTMTSTFYSWPDPGAARSRSTAPSNSSAPITLPSFREGRRERSRRGRRDSLT